MKRLSLVFCGLFALCTVVFPQESTTKNPSGKVYMPLPGVSDKINTEDIITKLIFVKRIPIQKKETENQNIKIETDILKDLSKYFRDLDTKSKGLYDFQNPFGDMTGDSSDKSVLEAIAGRKAKKDSYKVTVFQTAKPDSFMSSSLPRNQKLQAGSFTITVGDRKYNIKFGGGTLAQLMANIREAAGDDIDAKLVNDTASTFILVLSGKKTGEKNKIVFSGDTKVLFEAGILKMGDDKTEESVIDFSGIDSKSGTPISSSQTSVQAKPGTDGELNLKARRIAVKDKTILYFNARINRYDLNNPTNEETGLLNISPMEGVTVSNVTVAGGSLITTYEEQKEIPAVISNFTEIFTLVFNDGTIKTFYIDADGSFSNSLSTYSGKTIDKMLLKNANTDRDIVISGMKVVSILEEGGLQPKNAISKACDAIISFNGVEIKRDKNLIDDLIDGVTLNLLNESKTPVTVTIDHNYKKVEDSILAWVDSYNKCMEYLAILTRPSLDKTPLSERTQDSLKIGVFQTETSLLLLKNRLRSDASGAYKTDLGRDMALLEQIGVFTKKPGSFNASSDEWESTKMGLLTAEPDKLETALKAKFDAVAQLFANDTTGDLVKDTGAAFMINTDMRIVLGTGSFIERRIAINDNKVKDNNKDISDMNRDLADYELDLRRKYGKMNQVLSETEQKSKWLNNQQKAQQQGQ